ncbi:MAG TPA: hypothetical protein VFA38_03040 [Nitrospirales bacterium]|nr:hypothetical protein [Nitrospirales bacterium]
MDAVRSIIILCALSLWMGIGASPASSDPTSGGGVVVGDVLNIEGGEYILKDISGHEIHLRVDQSTELRDRIKVGDKVEARATQGHADSMRVRLPDDAPARPLGGYPTP